MAEPVAKRARLEAEEEVITSSPEEPTAAAAAGETAANVQVRPSTPGRRRRRSPSPTSSPKQRASPAAKPASKSPSSPRGNSGKTAAAAASPEAQAAAAATAAQQPKVQASSGSVTVADSKANGEAAQTAQQQQQRAPSAQKIQGANQQSPQQQQQQQQQQGHPAAAASRTPQQQQQQQQQQGHAAANGKQQQLQPNVQEQSGKGGKGRKKSWVPYLSTFHQCVKRELPYEAVHAYRKIQETTGAKLDLSLCNGLLNVAVGNWQWELHQRHQHLQRQYIAEGQDTGPLQAAFDDYLAAQRERLMAQQQQHQQQRQRRQQQQQEQDEEDDPVVPEVVVPPGTPAAMVCHIVRASTDTSCSPEQLHSRQGIPDAQVFEDMPALHKPFTQLLSDVMSLVCADVEAAGGQPDEQLLMGLARVAGIMGDPDKALDYAQQLVARKGPSMIPRLRDFQPALVGFALTGQADKAGEVVRLMMEHCQPSDLTESEFALWLEAIAGGGTYDQLAEALQAIAGELNELKPTTLALVHHFFESDRGAAALAPGGAVSCSAPSRWQVQEVVPDDKGRVAEADVQLALSDLTAADWELFDSQVFKLGQQQEKVPGQFESFRSWLDKHGPFDITMDGANLAFFGENYAGGSFKCWKVRTAYETLQEQHPEAKILVILHESRNHQTRMQDQETSRWLKGLYDKNLMYITPRNMNDDMFWMYAPIRGRAAGRLVSNDKMRDHVWSMLRPKHMLKWKARHIINYNYSFDKSVFFPVEPKPYTPCVQQVQPGVWLLPSTQDGKWLLCRPQPV